MVGTSDTPKDLQDAPDYTGIQENAYAQAKNESKTQSEVDTNYFKKLARDCYESSTNWLNAGRRLAWNDSLRAFQSLHASDSKYLSTDFRYRSRLFRPKTRAMVRKAEAQTAAAFFANQDVVSVTATDDNSPYQLASAELNQALLQYRLTKTIPWFLTLVGARQDCEVMGICIAKAYWKFEEKYSHTIVKPLVHPVTGENLFADDGSEAEEYHDVYNTIADHPWVDLLSPENFRFDAGADWRNPISTSPYNIELIPMYICDVKARIKTGEWFPVSEGTLRAATQLDDDTTRRSREQGRIPGKDHDSWKPREYDICWIHENVVRQDGEDFHFFSVGNGGALLTNPRPIKEVYLHGIRPWVCGYIMPEAHKTYPTSKVEMVKHLQTQANDVVNLRLDNVKLALNPRQFLRQGTGNDPSDFRTFQPGKVISIKDPKEDIVWDRPPEVTGSSFQEQDRLNLDFDDITGDASNSAIQGNKQVYEAVGNMEMMQGNASTIGEYEMRVFAETFVQPILSMLVKLEQAYETDEVVIGIAGKQAKLYQKFGIDQITDDLLQQQLTAKVNVGLGATNPQQKLKNFMTATGAIGQMYGPVAAMASNPEEVIKEVFGLCGYKDGDRFFMPGTNIHQMMQQNAQNAAQGKNSQHAQNNPQQLQAAQLKAQTDEKIAQMELQKTMMEEQMEYKRTEMQEQYETQRTQIDHQSKMQQGAMNHQAKQMHPALQGLDKK